MNIEIRARMSDDVVAAPDHVSSKPQKLMGVPGLDKFDKIKNSVERSL